MSILVIGVRGQLAHSLDEAAKTAGVRLATVGRPLLDLREPDGIARAIDAAQPSLVINAAAYTAVDRAESEADLAFAINADAVECIGRACAERGIATLHLSTDYVFDGRQASPYREDDLVGPLGVYGRSKLAGEERLRQANPRHLIVRTAWVYSPFGSNFLKTMLRLAAERSTLSVVNDQHGSPTYAPFLATALLAIADHIDTHPADDVWGTYHAAGSGEATWFEFAREIFRQSGERGLPTPSLVPITTAEYPTSAARPANSRLDCSLLRDTFGLELPPWQLGVEACLERLAQPA